MMRKSYLSLDTVTITDRVFLSPGFVLHAQDYRETSAIISVFSQTHGLVKMVVRGGRRPHSPWRAGLQLFTPMVCSWTGRTTLKTVVALEVRQAAYPLHGEQVLGGLYMNEMLTKILAISEVKETLFLSYAYTLQQLCRQPMAIVLRFFERAALDAMGFAIDWYYDSEGQPIVLSDYYQFYPQSGFYRVTQMTRQCRTGQVIVDFSNGNLAVENVGFFRALLQSALACHWGAEGLTSQKLMQQLQAQKQTVI